MFAELRYKTGVDLDIEIGAWMVAALPDGQAVIKINKNDSLVRVEQGQVIKHLYTGSGIAGLLIQGFHFFVLHGNGTLVQMEPEDGLVLKVFNTGISSLHNYASHHTDLCDTDLDILLFASPFEVYTYNISSQIMKLRVKNLSGSASVTRGCVDGNVVYVVAVRDTSKVHVYNTTWSLIKSFGDYGTGNGQLMFPHSSVMSDEGYIFVADLGNPCVSMFTSDGQFVKYIIIYDVPYYESKDFPLSLSVRGQYLWVTTYNGRLTRYIL